MSKLVNEIETLRRRNCLGPPLSIRLKHRRQTNLTFIMRIFFTGWLALLALAVTLQANSPRHREAGKLDGAVITKPVSVAAPPLGPVTVGAKGNEPLIATSPDGTLYISALQHIYRSTDSGATWTVLPGPIYASTLNLASDSSISVDPANRLYFTFDYPYAGTTAVCTSDNHGDTFTCDPAVVPGGTDRMWVLAPSTTAAYEVTNQGLYETAFLTSTDRGATWIAKSVGSGLLEPQSGPLLQKNCSADVLQPIKVYGTTPQEVPELKIYVYHPTSAGSVISDIRSTGLPLPYALPSASFGQDGELWVSTEEANPAGGRQIVVARSINEGVTWAQLPPIPETTTGTAIFSWVTAGSPHHVGVLYYYTPDNGDPGALTNAIWSTVWAETFNADSAAPIWAVSTIESLIHVGPLCIAASCMGTNRFAGDFISSVIDSSDTAHLTWMSQANGTGAVSIRYAKVQAGPPSTFATIPCALTPTVVSRKMHGSFGPFDINLPQIGRTGVECRSGGSNGNYQMIATFPTLVTFDHAAISSGTGHVDSTSLSGNDVIVNLGGVANQQTINVTLYGVQGGAAVADITLGMGILIGDTNGDGFVNSADISQTKSQSGRGATNSNFREDVNVDGAINSGDISLTKSKSGTALP